MAAVFAIGGRGEVWKLAEEHARPMPLTLAVEMF